MKRKETKADSRRKAACDVDKDMCPSDEDDEENEAGHAEASAKRQAKAPRAKAPLRVKCPTCREIGAAPIGAAVHHTATDDCPVCLERVAGVRDFILCCGHGVCEECFPKLAKW